MQAFLRLILLYGSLFFCISNTKAQTACTWQQGDLTTYSQGEWGTASSDAGIILTNEFAALYFSNGGALEVGISGSGGYSIRFSSPTGVLNYLPSAGIAGALTADVSNPSFTASGLFGGEVSALELNIDFSDAQLLPGISSVLFGDLVFHDLTSTFSTFNGLTVRQALIVAETALGGGSASVSPSDFVPFLQDLNAAFAAGTPSQFALDHLRKGWQQGEMLTYSQTDYGNSGSAAAFALLSTNFNTLYPTTLNVGTPNQMIFDNAGDVYYYLPESGSPGVLTGTVLNPLNTSAGELGGEVLALRINVNFSDANLLAGSEPLGNLIIHELPTLPVMNGVSIRQFLEMANSMLGGTLGFPISLGQTAALARFINTSFLNGTPSQFAIDHLRRSVRTGDLETYTQTNWGDDLSDAGTLLSTHYAKVYGGNFLVGGNFRLLFTNAVAVHSFLPQLSSVGTLTANAKNPVTTPAGELAGEVTALELNVDFSDANLLPGTISLGDLVFHDYIDLPVLNGQSVHQFLAAANVLLGGGSASFTTSEAAAVARLINEAFLTGTPSQFATDHLMFVCTPTSTNNCPIATAAGVTTKVGTAINIQLQASDEDNDALTYSISQNPLHGTVTTSSTGAASYTPNAGYYGTDQFKFKANDGKCDVEGTIDILIVVCPKKKGDWKNNPAAWPVSATPMLLGTVSYTQSLLLTILNMPVGSGPKADASFILAHQLIPAKLSIANGTIAPVEVLDAIASADALIGNNTIPMKVKPNTASGKSMVALASLLEQFNSGLLSEGCEPVAATTSSKQLNTTVETVDPLLTDQLEAKAFPNPSTNNFSITVKANTGKERITMQVIDMYGRVIETRNVTANSMIRFGDRYRPGTYFVRIIQGKEHKEIKLIKLTD